MKKKWRKKLTKVDYLYAAISAIIFAALMYLINHKEHPEYGINGSFLAGVLFATLNLMFQFLFGNAFSNPPQKNISN